MADGAPSGPLPAWEFTIPMTDVDAQRIVFPESFTWGAATAAYQIEGAVEEDGRGETIWDRFCAEPGRIDDGSDGRVACDHYHRWREDVAIMAQLGLQAYRFSLAWSRILPSGTGATNIAGLAFYDRLIDGLLEQGIEPCPTLFHWDLPQGLQDSGGWANATIVDAFDQYADIVTRAYGDRVKHWFTLNEPNVFAVMGSLRGEHAPGLQDMHAFLATSLNLLKGHGAAVRRVRANVVGGEVGMVMHQALHPSDLGVGSVTRERVPGSARSDREAIRSR